MWEWVRGRDARMLGPGLMVYRSLNVGSRRRLVGDVWRWGLLRGRSEGEFD